MLPYLEEFDAAGEREPFRSILSRQVVPSLVDALGAEGLDVLVSHDLASKAAYNALHADDPLLTKLPLVDPRFQPGATERDTICVYLSHHGELVGSIIGRLLWVEGSFGAAVEDMTALYENPETMAGEDETTICQPSIAWDRLRSVNIAWLLGGHVRKDFRRGIAYDAMARLARIKVLVDWRWTYCLCLIEKQSAGKLGFRRYGYEHAEPGVYFGHGDVLHPYDLYVSSRDYLRRIFCRPEAADLSRGIGDLTNAELQEARMRRGSLRMAE